MGCRNNGSSDQWVVGLLGCRNNGLSDQWVVGIMGRQTNGLSDYWAVGIMGCRTNGLSEYICNGSSDQWVVGLMGIMGRRTIGPTPTFLRQIITSATPFRPCWMNLRLLSLWRHIFSDVCYCESQTIPTMTSFASVWKKTVLSAMRETSPSGVTEVILWRRKSYTPLFRRL